MHPAVAALPDCLLPCLLLYPFFLPHRSRPSTALSRSGSATSRPRPTCWPPSGSRPRGCGTPPPRSASPTASAHSSCVVAAVTGRLPAPPLPRRSAPLRLPAPCAGAGAGFPRPPALHLPTLHTPHLLCALSLLPAHRDRRPAPCRLPDCPPTPTRPSVRRYSPPPPHADRTAALLPPRPFFHTEFSCRAALGRPTRRCLFNTQQCKRGRPMGAGRQGRAVYVHSVRGRGLGADQMQNWPPEGGHALHNQRGVWLLYTEGATGRGPPGRAGRTAARCQRRQVSFIEGRGLAAGKRRLSRQWARTQGAAWPGHKRLPKPQAWGPSPKWGCAAGAAGRGGHAGVGRCQGRRAGHRRIRAQPAAAAELARRNSSFADGRGGGQDGPPAVGLPNPPSVGVPVHLLLAPVQHAGAVGGGGIQAMLVDVGGYRIGQQVAHRVPALQLMPHLCGGQRRSAAAGGSQLTSLHCACVQQPDPQTPPAAHSPANRHGGSSSTQKPTPTRELEISHSAPAPPPAPEKQPAQTPTNQAEQQPTRELEISLGTGSSTSTTLRL